MISTVAKKKPTSEQQPAPEPEPRPESSGTGRTNFKYVGLPVDLWERLKAYADRDERSVNWAAKKIIKDFLDRLDASDKPE